MPAPAPRQLWTEGPFLWAVRSVDHAAGTVTVEFIDDLSRIPPARRPAVIRHIRTHVIETGHTTTFDLSSFAEGRALVAENARREPDEPRGHRCSVEPNILH